MISTRLDIVPKILSLLSHLMKINYILHELKSKSKSVIKYDS